jgi:hypothetical protein
MVSPDFITLIQSSSPLALIVLAYFAILSELCEEWYLVGYAERVLLAVSDSIPAKWRPHLRWPEDQLREGLPAIS